MTKIRITTTQNIDIEYELATVFDRMIAWLVDFLIQICLITLLATLAGVIFPFSSGWVLTAFITPVALYHLIFEWLMDGRSLGKLAMNIKVVRLDGSPGNLGTYLVRWFTRGIETFPFFFFGAIGVTAVLLSPRGQRLGDLMAGTTVIRTQRKNFMGDTIFSRTGADYEPVFPAVAQLEDRDINTLREVLRLYRKERNFEILNAAANRVCFVLKIVPPSNLDAAHFIRTVIRDYNHLH